MEFSLEITPDLIATAQAVGLIRQGETLLEVTPFGDAFIERGEHIYLISFTDGFIEDVTELAADFGLPPEHLDLADEWYQLGTLGDLKAQGLTLEHGQCFGFITPLSKGGDYGPENVTTFTISEYWQDRFLGLTRKASEK